MGSKRAAVIAIVLVAAVLTPAAPSKGLPSLNPQARGRWSPPIDVGVIGIHATLFHTGEVLLFQGLDGDRNRAKLLDPTTGALKTVDVPFTDRDIFCSGHTVMPDGRLLVVGGEDDGLRVGGPQLVTIFDPVTETWSDGNGMAYGRYYPTATELPDGDALVFSGTPPGGGANVEQVERYDPDTETWTTLPPSANDESNLYPRMLLLPDGKLFMAGQDVRTRLFDPATNRWTNVGPMNYGQRLEGAAVLLPGLEKVLTAGGSLSFYPSTNTAEVIDFSEDNPRWRYTSPMHSPRMNSNLVLLPNRKVLTVGGGLGGSYGPPVLQSEEYNPATGRWKRMASQTAQRDYHSTAILLPDGRVLSAGQDLLSLFSETIDYYKPPYLFRGPRPTITSVPEALTYGESFEIGTPQASDISSAVLIRPGTGTHSVNFDQRLVDLDFSAGDGALTATAPGAPEIAPPGYYMLFILNSDGVPAIAEFVHLS